MANAILGLLAETPLHAGASASSGVIDLPIQREAHTGWPCVFGSGVKGALRTAADDLEAGWTNEVFGPPAMSNANGGTAGTASDHAGALSVGDARLLLLPVRSLNSHFKWVTCPALLRRAVADCERMGVPVELDLAGINPEDQVIIPEKGEGHLFLEELSFEEQVLDLTAVIQFLAGFLNTPGGESLLQQQLAIVSNNNFTHLAQFATPVHAHIAINNTTKTVKDGALWYEETLPPETVLYVCLLAHNSRKKDSIEGADEVLRHVTHDLFADRPYLQIGGNETTGMGWCKVRVLTGEGG